MNEMRKLMEAVGQINEGWDVRGIASAIYDEIRDPESQVGMVYNDEDEPEPIRAAIYEYGYLTALYNPKTLDGSEIWHKIVDELELLVAGVDERFMGEAVDLTEDNYEISPAIKKYFKDKGMYVSVKSIWSGQISKAISVEPATRGEKYAAVSSEDRAKVLPILSKFADENGLDAKVYKSKYTGRLLIEYAV